MEKKPGLHKGVDTRSPGFLFTLSRSSDLVLGMKLNWTNPIPLPPNVNPTSTLGRFLTLLGSGAWAEGKRYNYFIEASRVVAEAQTYMLDICAKDDCVCKSVTGTNMDRLKATAQRWEDGLCDTVGSVEAQ